MDDSIQCCRACLPTTTALLLVRLSWIYLNLYLWCAAEGYCWKTACHCRRRDQHWTCQSCWHQGCRSAAAQTAFQPFFHGSSMAHDAGCNAWSGMSAPGRCRHLRLVQTEACEAAFSADSVGLEEGACSTCHSWTCCAQQHQPHTCSTVCALALWKADAGIDCCLLLPSSPSSATVLTLASLCMIGEGGASFPRLCDLSSGCQHRRARSGIGQRVQHGSKGVEAELRQGWAG